MARVVGVIGRRAMVMPYKMLGFQVAYVEDKQSFDQRLEEWMSSDTYAIVFVEDFFYKQIDEALEIETRFLPAVIQLPSFEEGSGSTDQIEKMVEQAIGKKIV